MSGLNLKGSEAERLTPADLPGFKKKVKDAALELANDCGVKFRVLDGGHVRFYPPNTSEPVFKISRSRPEEETIKFIEKFKQVNDIEPIKPLRVGLSTNMGQALTDALEKTEADTAEERATSWAESVDEPVVEYADPQEESLHDADDDWTPRLNLAGQPSRSIEENGDKFRCAECHEEGPSPQAVHGHWMGAHHRPNVDEQTEEAKAKISDSVKRQRNTKNLFNNLAALGIEMPGTAKTEARIAKLEADLEAMKKRAETAEARLALIMEAARA